MFAIAERLSRLGTLWARSQDGLDQEEARKLFFQFRKRNVLGPEDLEPSEPQDVP